MEKIVLINLARVCTGLHGRVCMINASGGVGANKTSESLLTLRGTAHSHCSGDAPELAHHQGNESRDLSVLALERLCSLARMGAPISYDVVRNVDEKSKLP